MKTIVGLSGFGDAIYLEPLARQAIKDNPDELLAISTNYPDVFAHLPAKRMPYSRNPDHAIKFSYLPGKANPNTTQLIDMGYVCNEAFELSHAPIAILACGYPSMGSQDDLIPDKRIVEQIIAELNLRGYQILHIGNGSGDRSYAGTTKVTSANYFQTVAMFKGADLIVCQQGWGTALAEGLNKKCLVIFSHNYRINNNPFITQITPQKVCCKPTTHYVWDNEYRGVLPDAI